MLRKCFYIVALSCLILPAQAPAAENSSSAPAYMQDEIRIAQNSGFKRGSILYLNEPRQAFNRGQDVTARTSARQDSGLVLPDGRGGIIIVPGADPVDPNPAMVDARELKLKIRELSAQLLTGLNPNLANYIALPTTFVQQDDFERSSSFGRFISEQLFYEFNQRGLRTKEYRMNQNLTRREDGEFILIREAGSSPLSADTMYVAGTYFTDGQVLFLNARLLRSNGDVLRTGQLVMQVSPLTRRMLSNSGRKMPTGSLELKDFNTEARQPEAVTAFDRGLDIH